MTLRNIDSRTEFLDFKEGFFKYYNMNDIYVKMILSKFLDSLLGMF